MANPEHLSILKQGVEQWNRWRVENCDLCPDLKGIKLVPATLFDQLFDAAIGGASLWDVNLHGADLSAADLSGANLREVDLHGADISAADLSVSDLSRADLNGTTIYDVGDSNGLPYIAMEYVPGKTLAERISRRGLRLSEALKYGAQIADAMATAHHAGILHVEISASPFPADRDMSGRSGR